MFQVLFAVRFLFRCTLCGFFVACWLLLVVLLLVVNRLLFVALVFVVYCVVI